MSKAAADPGLRRRAPKPASSLPKNKIARTNIVELAELNRQIATNEAQKAWNHSPTAEDRALILANKALVHTDGETEFWIMPELPFYEEAGRMLARIAREFQPIIRRRGYRIQSVSEFYHENGRGTAGDGLDYSLGGSTRVLHSGDRIQGHETDTALGYNHLLRPASNTTGPFRVEADHTIHLRFREAHYQESFRPYADMVSTMAHELAHCVHRNHSDEFWALTNEILEEYRSSNSDTGGAIF